MQYKTVYQAGADEFTEKKSRFIGMAFPVESEEEVLSILDEQRRDYWNATHNNVYAYRIGTGHEKKRFSDDGEPAHTAGLPLLNLIEGEDLYNVLLVSVRYFGGTLLGTGGLVRAYTKAGQIALKASEIVTMKSCAKILLSMPYPMLGRMQYGLMQDGYQITGTLYTDKVDMNLLVEEERLAAFHKTVRQLSDGRLMPEDEPVVMCVERNGKLSEVKS